jgi:hypothetical protein
MKKGGAIVWMRVKLLGNWASHTTQAIAKVHLALNACIELLDTIGHLGGWKDYLVPDSIQKMALELLPSMRAMKAGVTTALQRASNEIRLFLEDLLGEQAAAVVMAAGERAVMQSAMPGARARTGHNAAAAKPRGAVQPRQPDRKTAGQPTTNASKGAGAIHTARRVTADTIKTMLNYEKALLGEHMADYFEMKRLSGTWTHDELKSKWSPPTVSKINRGKRPSSLRDDAKQTCSPGIDALWQHGGGYTITEAKASTSIGVAYGGGKRRQKSGSIPTLKGLNADQELLHSLLSDYDDKGGGDGGGLMQMNHRWCRDRASREADTPRGAKDAIESKRYDRRVIFVSFESEGALDHAEALGDIHFGKDDKDVHPHLDHGVTRVWTKGQIDVIDRAREKVREPGRAIPTAQPSTPEPRKGSSKKKGRS